VFSSAFKKQLLFFFLSVFGAGYIFAAGSSDFPEVSVASYDAENGIARLAINWKKVRADDERQFGLYRSTGEKADVYTLITTLYTSMAVYTDSGLNVDTEYHYIIAGALPRKVLPHTKERGRKERRAELSNPHATLAYGRVPAGPIAWIPPEPPDDYEAPSSDPSDGYQSQPIQTGGYLSLSAPTGGQPSQSAQSDGYPSLPAQTGSYPQQTAQSGYPSLPAQTGSYPPNPAQSGGYPSLPAQTGSYPPNSAQSGDYPPSPAQGGDDRLVAQPETMPPVFPYHEPVGTFVVPVQEPVFENGGVFFSMGYFSNRVFELSESGNKPAVVSLIDSNAKSRLVSLLRQSYTRSTFPGTSLYYAVHNAINRINGWDANGALSQFGTILLVTITDGLDTSSTDPALAPIDGLTFKNINTYQDYIKKTIGNKRIGGKKITAVSIGIRGTDTITEQDYGTTLRSVASAEDTTYRIPLRNLTKTLTNVASSVTSGVMVRPFGFITPAYPHGTEIFIALDGFSTPPRGQNFIAGRIKVAGNQLYLENITLGGLAKEAVSLPDGGVSGRIEPNGGVEWQFNFSEALNPAKVVFYYKIDKDWRGTKEFAVRSYAPMASRHPALVYLLIDNSVSMSNQNIATIREAVTKFIDALSVNPGNIQPRFTGGTAFVMTRLEERPYEAELAAEPPPEPQWERPPFPESNDEAALNDTGARLRPLGPEDDRVPDTNPPRNNQTPSAAVVPPVTVSQTAPGSSGYWVQTSSSENLSIAEQISAQLRRYHLTPVITQAQVRGRTFYRVRIGPYTSLAEASMIAEFVKKPPLGFYDSFIP
jgi:hypothetical protein